MSIKNTDTLQDIFIEYLITNQTYTSIYLKNSIRLKGCLLENDESCVFLRYKIKGQTQIIYKHEISTIDPITSILKFSVFLIFVFYRA